MQLPLLKSSLLRFDQNKMKIHQYHSKLSHTVSPRYLDLFFHLGQGFDNLIHNKSQNLVRRSLHLLVKYCHNTIAFRNKSGFKFIIN